jgi:hypothetical protein
MRQSFLAILALAAPFTVAAQGKNWTPVERTA